MRRVVGWTVGGVSLAAVLWLAIDPMSSTTSEGRVASRHAAPVPLPNAAARPTQSPAEAQRMRYVLRGLVVEGGADERRWNPVEGADVLMTIYDDPEWEV